MADFDAQAQIIEISNLIPRLAHAADRGTLDEYGALLAPDFTWSFPGHGGSELEAQVRSGKEDVLRGAQERRDTHTQGPGTHTRHVVTSISVVPDPDEPTATAYWHFYHQTNTKPQLHSMGVYEDSFVRSAEGRWLFKSRRIIVE